MLVPAGSDWAVTLRQPSVIQAAQCDSHSAEASVGGAVALGVMSPGEVPRDPLARVGAQLPAQAGAGEQLLQAVCQRRRVPGGSLHARYLVPNDLAEGVH